MGLYWLATEVRAGLRTESQQKWTFKNLNVENKHTDLNVNNLLVEMYTEWETTQAQI